MDSLMTEIMNMFRHSCRILATSMGIFQTYQADFRRNLTLALPIMAGQLGQILVNFIDNVMVGRLGPEALAAVSLSISIYISFMVVGMGISFALPPLIAEADGQNDRRRVSSLFKHSLIINISYALICVVIIELGLPVIELLGQDPEVVALAKPYLRLSAWAMIPMMLFQTFRAFSNGLSETMPPMIASLTGNVFNILFNYMFIYGKLGAPALGVEGAALGTLIAPMHHGYTTGGHPCQLEGSLAVFTSSELQKIPTGLDQESIIAGHTDLPTNVFRGECLCRCGTDHGNTRRSTTGCSSDSD